MTLVPADQRGQTVIVDRVVAKIAAEATSRCDAVVTAHHRPRTHINRDGHLATVEVELEARYPSALVEVSRDVRKAVEETVGYLCQIEIREVDVSITRLHGDFSKAPRVN